ncbi:glycosyltransferase [Paenibacillus mesotrionivorans]|uniref:Glycosyltransferase n=1 Tax=Paenibacillus mesotrionivorans TaxID=3160968 RepID=A0ACC7P0V3_9BACL
MPTLALVLIVRNEERCIGRCLASAAAYVDEIIVVDTGSTDRTKEIVLGHGIPVFDFVWDDDFAAARNYALSLSTSDWNLVLDADEYLTDFEPQFIRQFMNNPRQLGRIQIISETVVEGEENEVRGHITRLLPTGVGYKGRIHEQVDALYPRMPIPITVRHDGYLGTDKSGRNIPLLLAEIRDAPADPYYLYQLGKEYEGKHEWEASLRCYSQSYELLQGIEPYAPSMIVDYVYMLIRIKRLSTAMEVLDAYADRLAGFPDYHFVCGVFYLDLILSDPDTYLPYLPRIEAAYLRCLEIGEDSGYDGVIGTGSYAAWYNLGNYYEVLGRQKDALHCYRKAADMGYRKAMQRLPEIM